MSAFLLGIGFRADMGTCARKLVLLKLIDACEEDGTRIFPAISTIARAAQCSTRQVQRELQAFREAGLIRLVREGGKGPRSTNEYALDIDLLQRLGKEGWAAVTAGKGDTVSPLDEGEKGDTGDTERVTPETDKGDKLSHPTPPDPSLDPSIEREARERDPEDRKSIERAFEKAWQAWPTSVSDSRPAALKAWLGLSSDERLAAVADMARWLEANRAAGRKHVPAFGSYLADRRWSNLPPLEPEPLPDLAAAPFGKVWGAVRMSVLIAGPTGQVPPMTFTQRQAVEAGTIDATALMLERRAKYGFPAVNRMHERAAFGQGITAAARFSALGEAMEPVRVGSALWVAWQRLHEAHGWPWLPDPGDQEWVYFPAGGPERLGEFEAAVRGEDDAGGREAAE